MPTLSVLIPSRSTPRQGEFLARALKSVHQQDTHNFEIEVIVGLDPKAIVPNGLLDAPPARWVYAKSPGQAAALNACAEVSSGDYLAILEDDDTWHPRRLAESERVAQRFGFTSCTQLEHEGEWVVRINDFPTPSGWLMKRSTWERVGPFEESYRYHLDNEWLGRLAQTGLTRAHLIESTAPESISTAFGVRPWLTRVIQDGGELSVLVRHALPVPLVVREVHPQSGMARIGSDPAAAQRSQEEYRLLHARFGHLPW